MFAKKTRQIVWTGLLASVALAASAQTTPAPTVDADAQRMERGDPAQRFERMQQHRAQRLSALKDKLKLDASQEPAWNAFAAAQQPPAPPAQRPSREDIAKMTTPQRLDLMQQHQAERTAAFARRADATRTFYATLKPEQQKTFDAETLQMGLRGGPGHHGPRGHQAPPAPGKG